MPAIGSRPAEQPAYPAQLLRCPQCRARPARPDRGSGDPLPAELSLHQRHDADPARELRRARSRRGRLALPDRPRRPGRRHRLERRDACSSNFKEAAPRPRASSRPTPASSPTSAASRRSSRSSTATPSAEVVAQGRQGEGRHRRPTCFAHIEDVHEVVDAVLELLDARRRLHHRVALSARRCSRRSSTTRSTTSTCATTR